MPEASPLISVAVCTYNRASELNEALGTLYMLESTPGGHEIVVVDNNSPDGTEQVVRHWVRRNPLVRYCRESAQGLSHARNRAWREAKGEYVYYVDDDVLVPPGWLATAAGIGAGERPEVFGGPSRAFYNIVPPAWFKDEYGSTGFGPEPRWLGSGEYLDGMNVCFRRELLAELDGFDPVLGMSGGTVGFGEETEMQRRVRAARPGARVLYHPGLYLYHLVRPARMDLAMAMREAWAHGRYLDRTLAGAGSLAGDGLRAAYKLATLAWHLGPGVLLRKRKHQPRWQNYVFERAAPNLRELSRLWRRLWRREG